jgi:hypothetical protein
LKRESFAYAFGHTDPSTILYVVGFRKRRISKREIYGTNKYRERRFFSYGTAVRAAEGVYILKIVLGKGVI